MSENQDPNGAAGHTPPNDAEPPLQPGHPDEPGERFMVNGVPVRGLPDDELNQLFVQSQRALARMDQVLAPQFLKDYARAQQLAAVFAYESERRLKERRRVLVPR